jgi:hypothetical protein
MSYHRTLAVILVILTRSKPVLFVMVILDIPDAYPWLSVQGLSSMVLF